MNSNTLEYIDFAFRSILQKKQVEDFIFHNALNGLLSFMKSLDSSAEKNLLYNNYQTIEGVMNILKIYSEGGSCIHDLVEINFNEFNNLIEQFKLL